MGRPGGHVRGAPPGSPAVPAPRCRRRPLAESRRRDSAPRRTGQRSLCRGRPPNPAGDGPQSASGRPRGEHQADRGGRDHRAHTQVPTPAGAPRARPAAAGPDPRAAPRAHSCRRRPPRLSPQPGRAALCRRDTPARRPRPQKRSERSRPRGPLLARSRPARAGRRPLTSGQQQQQGRQRRPRGPQQPAHGAASPLRSCLGISGPHGRRRQRRRRRARARPLAREAVTRPAPPRHVSAPPLRPATSQSTSRRSGAEPACCPRLARLAPQPSRLTGPQPPGAQVSRTRGVAAALRAELARLRPTSGSVRGFFLGRGWAPSGLGTARTKLWRRQWHLTPVFSPGKSHGWRSLVGCSP